MDKLKRLRAPERTAVTKLVTNLEQALDKRPLDKVAIETNYQLLQNHYQKLMTLDDQIKDVITEAKDYTEDDYQREWDSIEEYDRKVTLVRVRMESTQFSAQNRGPSSSIHESHMSMSAKKTYKMPKIEPKKFNGETGNWLRWWAFFSKIHEDDDMDEDVKAQYLESCMIPGTRPYDLVTGFTQVDGNYQKVIKALTDRFGQKKILSQYYIRELLSMIITVRTTVDKMPLSSIHDKLDGHLRSLETLGFTVELMEKVLLPMVESIIPSEILLAWQRSADFGRDGSKEVPPKSELDFLMDFLKREIDYEEQRKLAQAGFGVSCGTPSKFKRSNGFSGDGIPTAAGLFMGSGQSDKNCIFCDKGHHGSTCFKAKKMTLEALKAKIFAKGACFQCLTTGHMKSSCSKSVTCTACKKFGHYPVICSGSKTPKKVEKKQEEVVVPTLATNLNCTSEVLLRTLIVQLINPNSQEIKTVRVLLDGGSQRSYVLRRTAQELNLKILEKVTFNHLLFGGQKVIGQEHGLFAVNLMGVQGRGSISITVMDQQQICARVPRVEQGDWIRELEANGIKFSDVDSANSLEVEMLIGADFLGKISTGGIFQLDNGLTAMETIFGWTLMGRRVEEGLGMTVISMTITSSSVQDLWELETIGIRDPAEIKSKEIKEKEVQDHFENTVSRNEDGRYCVSLPWINGAQQLPSNRAVAFKRLESTTNNLNSLGKFDDYNSIFNEWERAGIISEIEGTEAEDVNCHYLPHRAVIKDSVTTPVRPVFDASCKTGRNPSLNNCLEKGPNLLELIPSILLRFRMGKVGVLGDVEKAFLQMEIKPEDRKYLRFLWWKDKALRKLKIFQHNRVVFGVNASPFQLAAVINRHLCKLKATDPETYEKIKESMYVDNLVTTVDSDEEYEKFRKIATESLADAKMKLRQWERSGESVERRVTGVLGMKWDKIDDSLSFNPIPQDVPQKITKRIILSLLHSVYDPLGFLSPVLIVPKILLQKSWIENRSWDEEVSSGIKEDFMVWWSELGSSLKKVQIPRNCVGDLLVRDNLQFHVFSDASQKAYAAAVFLRVKTVGGVTVKMLQTKSRVAPVLKVSIPRLELLSCTIAARLADSVRKALKLEDIPIYYWSDSTTALAWIKRNDDWGTFVGNRVKEICGLSRSEQWRHVPGSLNPADLPSRGIGPKAFAELRWWEGPDWLKLDKEQWPHSREEAMEAEVNQERKRGIVTLLTKSSTVTSRPWYVPFHSYHKNLCVMAFVFRFVNATRKLRTETTRRPTPDQIETVELELFKIVQQESFVIGATTVSGMKVFADKAGILRVKTKLLHRDDTDGFKTPVLLPEDHLFVELLIKEEHSRNSHGGAQFLMSSLRERVWIVHGRRTVRKVLRTCVVCRRFDTKKPEVPTASLPQHRVQSNHAFQTAGVDLAVPLTLKNDDKCYIVLYTCAVYRAVHLELVDSLSTHDFLLSFIRFMKRMTRPDVVYSDNGKNFVGTENLFAAIDWPRVERETHQHRIRWIFNPPSAPWYGGFFERLIQSTKNQLKKMLGFGKLTKVEMETSLCQVQVVLNSRPLTFVTEDQDDLVPLTPSMFLQGPQAFDVPEADLVTVETLTTKRKKMKVLFQEIKDRFRSEYLGLLVQRGKERPRKFQLGEIVLVEKENHKRVFWPMARILELIPGKDGEVRVARLQTKNGSIVRPIQRLYPLEVDTTGSTGQPIVRNHEKMLTIPKIRDDPELESAQDPMVAKTTNRGRVIRKPIRFCDY